MFVVTSGEIDLSFPATMGFSSWIFALTVQAGYDPFLVVDTGEDEAFRARFAGTGQRALLDLTPVVTIGNTTIYAIR